MGEYSGWPKEIGAGVVCWWCYRDADFDSIATEHWIVTVVSAKWEIGWE